MDEFGKINENSSDSVNGESFNDAERVNAAPAEEAESVLEEAKAPEDRPPVTPQYRQPYVPYDRPQYRQPEQPYPKYGNTYYGDRARFERKNNGHKSAIVALSVVCVLCVVILAALLVVMWKNNWALTYDEQEPIPESGMTDEDGNKQAPGNGNLPQPSKDGGKSESGGKEDFSLDIKDKSGEGALSYNEVYKKCSPAAVGILCTANTDYFGRTYTSTYVGSGFIVDETGYIATNSHVVNGMDTITVYLADGTTYDAKLIGCNTFADVAVIKIEADEALPTLEFGDSSTLEVGDVVTAIGTPADISLAGTFTQGIISAVDRKVTVTNNGVNKTMKLLQTDATINPGNSGGPLINDRGQVIGINTMKLTDEFEGIGFAIPSLYAKQIVEQIIKTGGDVSFDPDNDEYIEIDETPQMGIVNCQTISESVSKRYNVPQGVQILLLESGCSLEENGAKVGDIITKLNGVTVLNLDELRAERDKVKPRTGATVTVYRNGEYIDINFTMGSNVSY